MARPVSAVIPTNTPEGKREYMKMWWQNNKEKKSQYDKTYYTKHKDTLNKTSREYYANNAEVRKSKNAEYYEKNIERIKLVNAKYYKEHKEHLDETRRAWRRNRRANKYKLTYVPYTNDEIYQRDEGLCCLCGKFINKQLKNPDPQSFSLQHLNPISKGGDDASWNIMSAHLVCNMRQGTKIQEGYWVVA